MNIRFITADEDAACNDFYNRTHYKQRFLDQWRWEFLHIDFDDSQIPFVVVEENGRIGGTQALIPIKMIDKDGVFWTAKSEETMIAAEYRGKKLFERMYHLLFEYTRKNNIRYIWGFTPAKKAFTRLGFETPVETAQLLFPFSKRVYSFFLESGVIKRDAGLQNTVKNIGFRLGILLAQCVASLKFFVGRLGRTQQNFTFKTLEEPPPECDKISEQFIEQWGGVTIFRNKAYLQWRFFRNPYVRSAFRAVYDNSRLLGWIAYTLGSDNIGYIVDIFFTCKNVKAYSAKDVAKALLSQAVLGARNMGAYALRGWSVTRHPFDVLITEAAKEMGFFHIKKGFTVVIKTQEQDTAGGPQADIDSWYINRIYTEGRLG